MSVPKEIIKDDELFTPTESYILDALLEKIINSSDMSAMHISQKASELKEAIDNS